MSGCNAVYGVYRLFYNTTFDTYIGEYNIDTYIGAKKVVYLSYITLTHTSAGYIHGQIIDDELSNQSLCFVDLENFVINHFCTEIP